MCTLVQPQSSLGAQAFAALATAVPLAATLMHLQHMPFHIFLALELLGTHFAREVPLAAVHVALVALQVAAVGKGLATGVAPVHHFSGHTMVVLDMFQETLLVQEGLVTDRALEVTLLLLLPVLPFFLFLSAGFPPVRH